MSDKEATVRLGLEGEDEIARGAERLTSSFGSVGEKIRSSVGGAVSVVGRGVAGLIQDSVRLATAMNTISLGQAVEQSKQLDSSFTRFSIGARRGLADIRQEIRGASLRSLIDEGDLERISRGFGRVTYDLQGAVKNVEALQQQATLTGRTVEEELNLGAVLENSLGVTKDMGKALGTLNAQAEQLGTVGGPAAFGDMIAAAGGQMSALAVKSEEARNKLTGFLGAMTKGYGPEAQKRVASSILGTLQGNVQGINRTLGRDITDENGQIRAEDVPKIVKELRDRTVKHLGANRAKFALQNLFGTEAGAAVMRGDYSAGAAAAGVTPSSAAAAAQASLVGSEAGQRERDKLARDQNMRDAAKPIANAQSWWGKLWQDHPLAGNIVSTGLGGAVSGAAGWLARGGGSAVNAAKGAASAVGAAAGSVGSAALDAEAAAARVLYQVGPAKVLQGGLKTGIGAVGALGTGLLGVGGEVLVRGLGSLSKDSELAHNVQARQRSALAAELAGQVARNGDLYSMAPELVKRAGGDEGVLKEMLQHLSKMQLPDNLAKQVGEAVAEAMRANPPQIKIQGQSPTDAAVQADKASGEGSTK